MGPLGGSWRVRGLGERWTITADHMSPANVWTVYHHCTGVGLEWGQDGGRKTVKFMDKCPERAATVRDWVHPKRGAKAPTTVPRLGPCCHFPQPPPLVTDDKRPPFGRLPLGAKTVTSSKGGSREWISLVGASQPAAGGLSNWWNPISILEGFPPQEQ